MTIISIEKMFLIETDLISSKFLQTIKSHNKTIIIVAEEAGWGVVPATTSGMLFRDRLGSLTQKLEGGCQNSWLVLRGRAINLKSISRFVK